MSSTDQITNEHGKLLLDLAIDSIEFGIHHGQPIDVEISDYPEALAEPRAAFVTLTIRNDLRGCIGSIEACRPLVRDIAHNAYAAAFSDPRFPPLEENEFEQLIIHLSILSEPEPIACASEKELLVNLRPYVDGLILEEGGRRGTFLPAVWESLPDPKLFLAHLKEKTGLSADYWPENIRAYRYQAHTVQKQTPSV